MGWLSLSDNHNDMNNTPLCNSWYQQEDDNDILLQLLRAKISIDESTGIRIIDRDKDVFRQEDGCVIARDGDRLHICLTMDEDVKVPDGVKSIAMSAIHQELCPNIRHVIFPQSVEAISGYAIIRGAVEDITIHNAGAYISDDAVSWCPSLRASHYPSENKTIYRESEPTRQVCHVEEVTEEWADEDLLF